MLYSFRQGEKFQCRNNDRITKSAGERTNVNQIFAFTRCARYVGTVVGYLHLANIMYQYRYDPVSVCATKSARNVSHPLHSSNQSISSSHNGVICSRLCRSSYSTTIYQHMDKLLGPPHMFRSSAPNNIRTVHYAWRTHKTISTACVHLKKRWRSSFLQVNTPINIRAHTITMFIGY